MPKGADVENSAFNSAGSVNLPINHLFGVLAVTVQKIGESITNIIGVTHSGLKNCKFFTIFFRDASTNLL